MQGLGGGGMVPVATSILVDAFPPTKGGKAFALFGVAVVVAPDEIMTEPPLSTVALRRSEIPEVVPPGPTLNVLVVMGFNATLTPLLTVRPASTRRPPPRQSAGQAGQRRTSA